MGMLDRIRAFVEANPGLKARTIAGRLDIERSAVTRLLHEHPATFMQDGEFRWNVVSPQLRIEFGESGWLTEWHFERALSKAQAIQEAHYSVVFAITEGGKPLLEFLARLLALCNQLVEVGKSVTLDFHGAPATLTYLDRLGYFDVLSTSIAVLPCRPDAGRSHAYRGNNLGLMEFRSVDPKNLDGEIPPAQSFTDATSQKFELSGVVRVGDFACVNLLPQAI